MAPTLQQVLNGYQKKGYVVFPGSKPYDLNIFGVRATNCKVNSFCDWLGVFFKDGADWEYHVWSGTTDPGAYWLQNPMNINGTAIVVPGQYRKSHSIGLHQGKYEALVQTGPVKVYRDNNKDLILDHDPNSVVSGCFGINIHRASAYSKSIQVDKWSAGCQVFADPKDFAMFMDICHLAKDVWGPTFTYTLLDEVDCS